MSCNIDYFVWFRECIEKNQSRSHVTGFLVFDQESLLCNNSFPWFTNKMVNFGTRTINSEFEAEKILHRYLTSSQLNL
jgi:hypothetical protein